MEKILNTFSFSPEALFPLNPKKRAFGWPNFGYSTFYFKPKNMVPWKGPLQFSDNLELLIKPMVLIFILNQSKSVTFTIISYGSGWFYICKTHVKVWRFIKQTKRLKDKRNSNIFSKNQLVLVNFILHKYFVE